MKLTQSLIPSTNNRAPCWCQPLSHAQAWTFDAASSHSLQSYAIRCHSGLPSRTPVTLRYCWYILRDVRLHHHPIMVHLAQGCRPFGPELNKQCIPTSAEKLDATQINKTDLHSKLIQQRAIYIGRQLPNPRAGSTKPLRTCTAAPATHTKDNSQRYHEQGFTYLKAAARASMPAITASRQLMISSTDHFEVHLKQEMQRHTQDKVINMALKQTISHPVRTREALCHP